jgi:hypothetical protein
MDFFDTRVPKKKANTINWPKFPHHKNRSKVKILCLKYQSKWSCSTMCYMAHVDPSKMEAATKKTINDRFKSIYS